MSNFEENCVIVSTKLMGNSSYKSFVFKIVNMITHKSRS